MDSSAVGSVIVVAGLLFVGPLYLTGVVYMLSYGISTGWHRGFISAYKPKEDKNGR